MMKKNYQKPRRAKSTDTSASFLAAQEREILARKAAQGNNQTGVPMREVANNMPSRQNARSPENIGTGVIYVPEGAPLARTLRITIDSTGQTQEQEIVIGAPELYAAKGGTKFKGNPNGMVYSGSKDSDSYPIWLNDVKQNPYIFHMVQLSVTPSTYKDKDDNDIAVTEAQANAQLYEEWQYIQGNVQERYCRDRIDIFDSRNPYQEDKNLTIYTFNDNNNRLDAHSCFVIPKFRPGIIMELRFRVTAVLNGRV